MRYSTEFKISACKCCSEILRDQVYNSGRNVFFILNNFKDEHLDDSYSVEEAKNIIKSIYFGNLANDKYGKNNATYT